MNISRERFEAKIADALNRNTIKEVAAGFLRYEALRKLNMRELAELHTRNLDGERFDDMIDEIVCAKLCLPSGILRNTKNP